MQARNLTPPQEALDLVARPESVATLVYEQIRSAIVSKRLPPGARVTEAGLAEQMNVSKTPVREALLKLRQVGLIESAGLRGGRVVQPSPLLFHQAYEVREALEAFTAAQAAVRARPADQQRIRAAAEDSLQAALAGDRNGFRQADAVFHSAITESGGNQRIAVLLDECEALILTLRQRDLPHSEMPIACGHSHVDIAEAITARESERAGAAMNAHIRYVRDYMVASFFSGSGPTE
jgi:DNA-binding GntR family transcriptional regulator